MDKKAIYASMVLLRNDAIVRGFQEAAITYGWTAIRLGDAIIGTSRFPSGP